jgi:hypothetical protein
VTGGFDSPSDDGGRDEFREFFRTCASNSSTREVSAPTWPRITSASVRIASTADDKPRQHPDARVLALPIDRDRLFPIHNGNFATRPEVPA